MLTRRGKGQSFMSLDALAPGSGTPDQDDLYAAGWKDALGEMLDLIERGMTPAEAYAVAMERVPRGVTSERLAARWIEQWVTDKRNQRHRELLGELLDRALLMVESRTEYEPELVQTAFEAALRADAWDLALALARREPAAVLVGDEAERSHVAALLARAPGDWIEALGRVPITSRVPLARELAPRLRDVVSDEVYKRLLALVETSERSDDDDGGSDRWLYEVLREAKRLAEHDPAEACHHLKMALHAFLEQERKDQFDDFTLELLSLSATRLGCAELALSMWELMLASASTQVERESIVREMLSHPHVPTLLRAYELGMQHGRIDWQARAAVEMVAGGQTAPLDEVIAQLKAAPRRSHRAEALNALARAGNPRLQEAFALLSLSDAPVHAAFARAFAEQGDASAAHGIATTLLEWAEQDDLKRKQTALILEAVVPLLTEWGNRVLIERADDCAARRLLRVAVADRALVFAELAHAWLGLSDLQRAEERVSFVLNRGYSGNIPAEALRKSIQVVAALYEAAPG